MRKILAAAVLILAAGIVAFAQNQPKAFEVASIKPLGPFSPIPALGPGCDGGFPRVEHNRFTVTTTVFALITWAYGFNKNGGCSFVSVGDFLTGGPDWIRSEKFEVRALMPDDLPENATFEFLNGKTPALEAMIARLLADRFKLVVHKETKQAPVYNLVVANGGPKLNRPSAVGPERFGTGRGRGDSPGTRVMRARTTMTYLALMLVIEARRPVIDRTGLTGDFEFELEFAPFNAPVADSTAPDLFTAVQEQLGLKLESARAPVDVLVIDRAERPSEN